MKEVKVKEVVAVKDGSIKARWNKLHINKSAVLTRARRCAELTIPALLPPEGTTEQMQLMTPYQSLGARAVNNLASKLLLALLPPNTPFFRCMIDEFTLQAISQDPSAKTEINKAMGKVERAVMEYVEMSRIRVSIFEALKLLIATGNSLIYAHADGGMKVYKLDQFCVKRDPMGNVMEIVTQEKVHPVTLPESIRHLVTEKMKDPNESIEVYTQVKREEKSWKVKQEVDGNNITEAEGEYKLDENPFLVLRWTAIAGEDYGRGLVEEYIGDLISLEGLMEAIVLGSAAAAKVIFLVNPNGSTSVKTLRETPSGGFGSGNDADVTVLQLEKFADFKIASETIERLERRLMYAFLLNSSVQRDAERVTAEEIRYIAGELEDSLGGQYSILSQDLQLPLINILMRQMTKLKKLPKIPKEIKPVITTGLEALGRGHDLNKLNAFVNQLQPLGEETLATWLEVGNYITRVGTALGIDTEGLVKTSEAVEQAMQQRQQMALLQSSAAGGVAREVTKGAMNAQTQEG